MTRTKKFPLCHLVGLACFCAVGALAADPKAEQYRTIADRNVFGLKPPVQESAPKSDIPRSSDPPLKLTGITTIFGDKQALLKGRPPQPNSGEQQGADRYYTLAEGQREGDIEMVAIDAVASIVTVKVNGEAVTLRFPDDVAKLSSPELLTWLRPGATKVPKAQPQTTTYQLYGNVKKPVPPRSLRGRGPMGYRPTAEPTVKSNPDPAPR